MPLFMELAKEKIEDKPHSTQECGDNIQTEIANILRHNLCVCQEIFSERERSAFEAGGCYLETLLQIRLS